MESKKIYVDVIAEFTKDGFLKPRGIRWESGELFQIDRIKEAKRAAAMKAGGAGLRYTCVIRGQDKYLYYEDNNRWFVEGK